MSSNQTAGAPPASLPESLCALAQQRIDQFCERHPEQASWLESQLSANPVFAEELRLVWSCSPFVFENCLNDLALLAELVESGDLERVYPATHFDEALAARLAGADDEKVLHRELRHFRRREMTRLVWRDFSRRAQLLETTGDVTRLAEACIGRSLDFLHPLVAQQMGTPIGKHSGSSQRMVVLGMGKMGAWELNVSSDIDLIFAFPEAGETEGTRRQYSNQEFFLRLAQRLIQALDNRTADGFVFRVDMRLRPYGESGAMVLNFDAMEEYYQTQGRDWERYAMIKARVVAGPQEEGGALMAILRPFTYRKYIDFSAIQSLRDMKTLINREVARLGAADDVKKGAGGIREVEFIAQAFQLIRGGKDKRFQNPSLKHVLELLGDGLLPAGEAEKLWDAYVFLRNTEHVLQGSSDRQTQLLPDAAEDRQVVATVMGFADWEAFRKTLSHHREAVQTIFAGIAATTAEEREEGAVDSQARGLWLGAADREFYREELEAMGFDETEALANLLFNLKQSRSVQALPTLSRARLDKFIPLLLNLCRDGDAGHVALQRILLLVEAILRRSAYLVLMLENPGALRQLVYLCGESKWIAEQISRYPALLDELLDPRSLYTPQDKSAIRQEMRQDMLRIPSDDLEAQMEALRYFRRAQALRISACEVEGVLPLMKVSDNLTWLAEVILEQVLAIAWEWMASRHGRPGTSAGAEAEPGLAVIGYGKLGGLELGHGSDLDLVFIHDADPKLHTDGEKSIDNNTFFMRLCQRMIHILSTQTPSGDLYEVDARLRPNGNSGMLVTTLTAFEKYQREDAWTWEHQALVRARPVAGSDAIAGAFDEIRRAVLGISREEGALRAEVVAMREKMRVHLGSKAKRGEGNRFHIKQDAGGIVDIEFLVQYQVLRWAPEHPKLLAYTDNMRILDVVGELGLLDTESVKCLQQAYVHYRTLGHRLSLQGDTGVIDIDEEGGDAVLRRQVVAIWERCFR